MNRVWIVMMALGLLACRPPVDRPLETLEVTSPPNGSGPTRLDVDMPGGQLDVLGGADGLVEGTLRFDHPDMKPRMEATTDEDGALVHLTADWYPGIGPTTNLWTVALPSGPPFDLDLMMGSGRLNIAPHDVTVRSLKATLNYGETLVDLSGTAWEGTLEVLIEIGNGPQTRVIIPDDAGVRLRAVNSVGTVVAPSLKEQDDDTWVGPGYGERERTLELNVRIGTGDVVVYTVAEAAAEEGEE